VITELTMSLPKSGDVHYVEDWGLDDSIEPSASDGGDERANAVHSL